MKRVLYLLTLLIFSPYIFCQDWNIIVQTKDATCKKCNDGEIIIKVKDGQGKFIYYLFDKEPWKKGKELQRLEKVNGDSIVFSNLNKGAYFIAVEDSFKNANCRNVELLFK